MNQAIGVKIREYLSYFIYADLTTVKRNSRYLNIVYAWNSVREISCKVEAILERSFKINKSSLDLRLSLVKLYTFDMNICKND